MNEIAHAHELRSCDLGERTCGNLGGFQGDPPDHTAYPRPLRGDLEQQPGLRQIVGRLNENRPVDPGGLQLGFEVFGYEHPVDLGHGPLEVGIADAIGEDEMVVSIDHEAMMPSAAAARGAGGKLSDVTTSAAPAWRLGRTSDRFAGRVALVTGAGGAGIGSAVAQRLASEGAAILALESHTGRTSGIVDALESTYDVPVLGLTVDVADRPAVDAALQRAAH